MVAVARQTSRRSLAALVAAVIVLAALVATHLAARPAAAPQPIGAVTHTAARPSAVSAARPPAPATVVDTDGLHAAGRSVVVDGDVDHRVHAHVAVAASAGRGYAADVSAIRAGGYTVAVPNGSPAALWNTTVTVSRQLSALGVPLHVVHGGGVSTGIIRVSVKGDCTGSLLGLTSRTQGGVWNTAINNWTITSLYSSVGICTNAIKAGGTWLTATVQHEMGHALGLGHYPTNYKSAAQIMKPVLSKGMVNYHAGDVAGIRYLIAGIPRR